MVNKQKLTPNRTKTPSGSVFMIGCNKNLYFFNHKREYFNPLTMVVRKESLKIWKMKEHNTGMIHLNFISNKEKIPK